MVVISEGTVFNTDAQALVNTVNCKGVMGAGIALEFQLRYPEMNADYVSKCEEGLIKVGKVDYFSGDPLIINFPTKYDFKYPSKIEWIEAGLQDFVNTYKEHDIVSVAFPKLGAGRGGLEWQQVKELMIKYLSDLDITVYICEDSLRDAQGVEKDMIEKLNRMPVEILSSKVRLSKKQCESIEKGKPYSRFWHLSKTGSIGAKTYENLFQYFYRACNLDCSEQISLIDEGLL